MLVRNILSSGVRDLLRLGVNHAVVNSGVANPRSQARPIIEMGPITLKRSSLCGVCPVLTTHRIRAPAQPLEAERGAIRLLAGYFMNSEGGWWR